MSKTHLVVKLATEEIIPVRSRFEDTPPTIIIEFPPRRVAGALPERTVVQRGVIQEIQTTYATAPRVGELRWIQALRIRLQAPYAHRVHPEPGRIVIEIEHPQALTGEAMEVGLAGGIIAPGMAPPKFNERFRAMQEALVRASPRPWQWRLKFSSAVPEEHADQIKRPAEAFSSSSPAQGLRVPGLPVTSVVPQPPVSGYASSAGWWWIAAGIGLVGAWGAWLLWRLRRIPVWRRGGVIEPGVQGSVGIRIIDQLVWRAFERQGYQPLQTVELAKPPGVMRVMIKEGLKAALLCIGDGTFFEKTVVEEFVQSMQTVQVERGYLIAPGSFTVPAQRSAKEHGVTLLGRDQLMELLSEGAMSEYYMKQLQQAHRQFEEAKETLGQYAQQLDLLRRQRNEASWFLGEERTKTAKLEEQLAEAAQQIRQGQAQAEQWQATAEANHKQWEESQWYLGEAKASVRHLEEQIQSLREAFGQLEGYHREATEKLRAAEQQRDEANWYLQESQASQATLSQQVQQLEGQLAQTQGHLEAMRKTLEERQRDLEAEQLKRQAIEAELVAVRSYGERRKALRLSRSDAMVELQSPEGMTLFQGIPRDISSVGFGIESLHSIDLSESLRVRLSLPNLEQPVESTGRLVWQRQDPTTHQYRGGCELVDLPTDAREAFEQALANL